jgi:hypothetical protein
VGEDVIAAYPVYVSKQYFAYLNGYGLLYGPGSYVSKYISYKTVLINTKKEKIHKADNTFNISKLNTKMTYSDQDYANVEKFLNQEFDPEDYERFRKKVPELIEKIKNKESLTIDEIDKFINTYDVSQFNDETHVEKLDRILIRMHHKMSDYEKLPSEDLVIIKEQFKKTFHDSLSEVLWRLFKIRYEEPL